MWILNFLPSELFVALILLSVLVYFLSTILKILPYRKYIQYGSIVICLISTFIFGASYNNNIWVAKAKDLQHKVEVAEAKSQEVNEVIKERVVTKTQVIKQRGENTTEYITREVVKHDPTCIIPAEFVTAHNMAAKAPK
jgi:hypothetical protein